MFSHELTSNASVHIGEGRCSGSYMIHNNKTFVLTSEHCVLIPEIRILITDVNGNSKLGNIIYRDPDLDIAIILVHIPDVMPIKYIRANIQPVTTDVIYTGHSLNLRYLTFTGKIAGHIDNGYYIVNGFVWYGLSGAVIFTKDGQAVGVVSSLTVGTSPVGHHMFNNIMKASNLSNFDIDSIIK